MATLGFVVGIMGPVILMSQATKNLDRSAPQLYYPVSSIGRVIASQTLQFSIVIIILDLFLGIYILKLIGILLIFWAFYRNGKGYLTKTAFEMEENKNIKTYLVLGAVGAIALAIMEYSNLKQFLCIRFSLGVILGCSYFIFMKNDKSIKIFTTYISIIVGGIIVVLFLYSFNLMLSIFIGLFLIITYVIVRGYIESNKIPKHFKITVDQDNAMRSLQKKIKLPIPNFEEVQDDTFGVSIEGNNIVGLGLQNIGLKTLPKPIKKLPSLQKLDLSKNKLKTLPDLVKSLKSIRILDLSENSFKTIPNSLWNLISLEELYLYYNKISHLPESIIKLKSIQILNLNNNVLTKLPEALKELATIQKLDLGHNKFTVLPPEIPTLKSLEILCLQYNQISNLPETIGNLKALKILFLNHNQIPKIPNSIGNLDTLEELNLSDNRLEPKSFPESIEHLDSLLTLDLSRNKLKIIPETISNFTSLEKLYLSDNELNTIPMTLEKLESLETLELSRNNIHALPESLINLKSLINLNLEKNPLLIDKDSRDEYIINQLKKNGVEIKI